MTTHPETTALDDAATSHALRQLNATQRGSRDFYQEAAERATEEPLQRLFEEAARQRDRHAAELAVHIPSKGAGQDQPVTTGDRLRESWLKMRGLLNGGNPYVLLIEAERAEDRIQRTYQKLRDASVAESPLGQLLARQCEELEVIHLRVLTQRERAKANR